MLILVAGSAESASVTLAWDANSEPDLAGYVVYYGTASGVYGSFVDVGNVTRYTVGDLTPRQQYFFAVNAYNTGGIHSALSSETNATVVYPLVAGVTVTPTTANLRVGATTNLTAHAYDAANNPLSVPLTWSTAISAPVTLSATSGAAVTITAAGAGTTSVMVSSGSAFATTSVTVTAAPAVSRVAITPASANMLPAQTQQFVAIAYDATNAAISGVPFTWTTSSASVAPLSTTSGSTVSITAQSAGTAMLTATATTNGTFAQATVTVAEAPTITSVTVTPSSPTVALGWKQTLTAQGLDSSNHAVPAATFTWTTSNSAVAKLVTTGDSISLIGEGLGTATVTATEAGGDSATATIAVVAGDTLVWDTFTGTNGTVLPSHVPDSNATGSPWSTSGSASPTLLSGLAQVTTSGAESSIVHATVDTAAPDVRVLADWQVQSANPWGGLALRWTDANNFVFAGYRADGELAVYRVQDGIWTRLVGAPLTVQSGTTHQLEAVTSGSSITVYWDGGLLLRTSDIFNQTATSHGLAWANGVDTASGYDSLRIGGTPVAAAPAPPPAPSPAPAPEPAPPAPSPPTVTPTPTQPPSTPTAVPTPTPTLTTAATAPLQPYAPSRLISTVTGATVVLQWAAPTLQPTANYVIEAGSASGLWNLAFFDTGNKLLAYTASPVGPDTYFVRVRARGVNGELTAASNETIVIVGDGPACSGAAAAPVGLGFVVQGSTVTLNWQAPSGGAASYVVEAGSFPGGANLVSSDTQNPATSFTAAGVGAGTYFVRIRAKDACGATSGASNEVVIAVGR